MILYPKIKIENLIKQLFNHAELQLSNKIRSHFLVQIIHFTH